jgi:hypothetical protein
MLHEVRASDSNTGSLSASQHDDGLVLLPHTVHIRSIAFPCFLDVVPLDRLDLGTWHSDDLEPIDIEFEVEDGAPELVSTHEDTESSSKPADTIDDYMCDSVPGMSGEPRKNPDRRNKGQASYKEM